MFVLSFHVTCGAVIISTTCSIPTFAIRSPIKVIISCKILYILHFFLILYNLFSDVNAFATITVILNVLPSSFTRRTLSNNCQYTKMHFLLSLSSISPTPFSFISLPNINLQPLFIKILFLSFTCV